MSLSQIILDAMEKIESRYLDGNDRWNALKAHLSSCKNAAANGDVKIPMNKYRAQELLAPLLDGRARGISPAWRTRLIEALEFVIENDKKG